MSAPGGPTDPTGPTDGADGADGADKDGKEEYMAEAMSRLSQALRNSSNPDEETSRQVREIQDQISRMLQEERLLSGDEDDDGDSVTSSQYYDQGAYMMGDDGYPLPPPPRGGPGGGLPEQYAGNVGGSRAVVPHTELPHYPTPWELWKKAHESQAAPREAPILTEDEWENLVERLNGSAKTRQISLMRKQHKHIAKELAGLNFKPRINPLSRDMAAENIKLYEGNRLKHVVKSKAEKIAKARHQKQQEEIMDCTFQPNLTNKARRKHRDVEDLMLYGEIKKQRMHQRRQYIQDLQDRELTFKPHVNRKSAQMVAKMAREGRLRPTGGHRGYTGTNEDPGHGEDTFAPKINKRSKGLKLKGAVYDRLYESARRNSLDNAAMQRRYINDHVKGAKVSPHRAKLMGREGGGSGGGRGGGSAINLKRPPQGPTTVVRYQDKYDFILRRFGATAVR
jgi:hypothetical protein